MSDPACARFLAWALPRLGLRWTGFRNLRGQVCKRIHRRLAELGLPDLDAYRARLESDPAEWKVLDGLCFVTISRFHRDHAMWDALREEVLPSLAERARRSGEDSLRCWSIGCASGEEPYSLSIVWTVALAARFPELRLRVLATDLDETVLGRARSAVYPSATLRELPAPWREVAFDAVGDDEFRLKASLRAPVELRRHDVRAGLPDESFQLVLCRNVVFTYFEEPLQRTTLARLVTRLEPGGAFVIGRGERLPAGSPLSAWRPEVGIFRVR